MATAKRVILWGLVGLLALVAIAVALNWGTIQRVALGGVKVYETTPPAMPAEIARPAILVFSKTNGFRHEDAIPVANALFADFAKKQGWGYFQTENGAAFSPEILKRFDAVVFNNVSGDVFTPEQKAAFKAFIENGGGYVGLHAAGDNSHNRWRWFVQKLIGAQFIGHPVNPQFQKATIHIEGGPHPATAGLPPKWSHIDEWYSFDRSVRRQPGFTVLATVDEASYPNKKLFWKDLSMGKDHPVIWWRCQGKGRVFYSALGHTLETYAEPNYQAMLLGATEWALRLKGEGCEIPAPRTDQAKGGN